MAHGHSRMVTFYRSAVAAFIVASFQGAGCASLGPPKAGVGGSIHQQGAVVTIGSGSVNLHVAQRFPVAPGSPLVIFASGDGGWFGSAIGMFDTIAASGYPVAGVSSRSLLATLRAEGRPISASHIVDAYRLLIATSRAALHLPPDTPVIVAGWSRGAALSVIVGAETSSSDIAGVIAIGLAADEDLNVDLDTDDEVGRPPAGPSASRIETYALVRRVQQRVAVIQASGDAYLAAAQARTLFGMDSFERRFFDVPASNHRFSGGATAFRSALGQALDWISFDQGMFK